MLYHKKYKVNPSFVLDDSIKWEITGNGAYIIAEYRGTNYFVKRYTMGPRIPPKSLPEPNYSEQMELVKWLENKQEDIRKLFKGISVDKDHIVVEDENFWDEDNMFVTVTRMIPSENKGFDYSVLDGDMFIKLCSDIALLIKKTHDAGVTHGDLKIDNLLIRWDGSELIPYLIDFDSSYPSDYATRKRKSGAPMLSYPIVFSEGYQSPEIAIYNFEDEGVIDTATITNKTDIFTLGIIFHKLWTGNFPIVVGDACPVGEAVYLNEEIKLDTKFNVSLGSKNNCKFSSLIMWMLSKDADKRPDAQQVIDALNDALDVDDYFESSDAVAKFDLEPHELHKTAIEIYTRETLKGMGLKSFAKVISGGSFMYQVGFKDGTEKTLSLQEVIDNGYGKAKETTVKKLWGEDASKIEYVSTDELAKLGVLSIEPMQAGYKKFYYVAYRNGGGFTTSAKGLVDRGYAKYKIVSDAEYGFADVDTPWSEHGTSYNKQALMERGVVKIQKVIEDGDKRYLITIKNDKGDVQNVVKVSYMKIMKFIK